MTYIVDLAADQALILWRLSCIVPLDLTEKAEIHQSVSSLRALSGTVIELVKMHMSRPEAIDILATKVHEMVSRALLVGEAKESFYFGAGELRIGIRLSRKLTN